MKKKIDLDGYNPRVGDFVVSWGSGFFAWLVRKLIFLKDGIKNSPSHNMHIHTRKLVASAEISGYKSVNLKKRLEGNKRIMVFRFKRMTRDKQLKLQNYTRIYFNKLYDFFLYLIRTFQIMIIFVPGYLYLEAELGLKEFLLFFVGLLILYIPIMNILRMFEKFTVACSEAEGELYKKIGLLKGVEDATNLSPQNWLWILLNNPEVALVFDSDRKKGKYA